MEEKKFNLIDEPWILVIDGTGQTQSVSMLEALVNAHHYKSISGELPTQDAAILRVLLAVVYASLSSYDLQGEEMYLENKKQALNHWQQIWEKEAFPSGHIERYLEEYREHFYLFHPETPFFQIAGLRNEKGKIASVTRIIGDVPNRADKAFFTNRTGEAATSLSYAEAVRWLIHNQAWDCAGIKSSIGGEKSYGGTTGWLGNLGVIYLEGQSLFETLMLNFLLVNEGNIIDFGHPSWEEPFVKLEQRNVVPQGYVDLLTWQSRRIFLFEKNSRVEGVLSSYGDVFEKNNTFIEQMSGWHRISQAKDKNKDIFIPNLFSRERLLWRDLTSILPYGKKSDDNRVPGIIEWRRLLCAHEIIESSQVRISTVGVEYDKKKSSIVEMVADGITFSAGLLTSTGAEWTLNLEDVLDTTDKAIFCLGTLARELAIAAGADPKNKELKTVSTHARETAYSVLDEPFRIWLAGINPIEDNPDITCIEWKRRALHAIEDLGREEVSQSSPKALVGKNEKTAALAYRFFKSKVNNILGFVDEKKGASYVNVNRL